ncbi:TIGR03767 family metallophosphoesterase [Streptomyces sp. AV19]|uniref:TIGR03767 family metallophosphoesterase n=1 Tax=Streptomyces sp. AV19 TaxID=2793068 RepID=UPI0018FEC5CF|nr:TIGR03767 family metallophosphoesterase [Streptomyces sp. AV19]MBH1938747.1 TIGR03767 family metallophosphoesterase [Streptomyces sp. AV19]MDG4534007.1 TIGR03767 family metallophosphoesterase [Streptomyces sp. AV19]
MSSYNRRQFLTGTAAVTAAASLSLADGRFASAAALDRAVAATAARAVRVEGTTLAQVAEPTGAGPYKRLKAGPGWPLVVRGDLAPRGARRAAARDGSRTALACFVQFTDLHLADTESPVRFEYLARLIDSAHRPHETLTVRGASSLVERVNALGRGPYTGAPFSLVMATGDNTDNHEKVELDWYLSVMGGGRITPNSGAPARYEGVQNSGSADYWNPESPANDAYKAKGFPRIPGLLTAAGRPFAAPGLRTPWYTTVGNHDDSVEGTLPDLGLLRALYTGDRKLEGCDRAEAAALADALRTDPGKAVKHLARLLRTAGPVRRVTPDPRRAPFTPAEFAKAHLDPRYTGAGPAGHGFTPSAVEQGRLYYTFRIAQGVLGVSLDTTNPAGFADGSIGTAQLTWLESVLKSRSGHWYDKDGRAVRGKGQDEPVVVFSHHTSTSMGNLLPDPHHPFEKRHDGGALVALLQRFPNVVAWVNGHSHENRITPHGHAVPERAFWEINTASHIDYPQQARIVELTDNGDGTLSLFTTLVESAAPYRTDVADTSEAGLAALYRELSYNDPYASPAKRLGTALDHNTELVLARPGRR